MRRYALPALTGLLTAGFLTGCAAPIPVMIASEALDGISYLTTGKSTTDHALSMALDQDCALHRIVTGVALCRDNPAENNAVASARTDQAGADAMAAAQWSPPHPTVAYVQTASLGDPPPFTTEPAYAGGDDDGDPAAFQSASEDNQNAKHEEQPENKPQAAPSRDQAPRAQVGASRFPTPSADMFFTPYSGRPANAHSRQAPGSQGSQGKPDGQPVTIATKPLDLPAVKTTTVAELDVPVKTAPSPSPSLTATPRYFIVVGSFSTQANARRAVDRNLKPVSSRRISALPGNPRVVAAELSGRRFYRVVLGPFDRSRTLAARRQLAHAGFGGAWPVPACAGTTRPGCLTVD